MEAEPSQCHSICSEDCISKKLRTPLAFQSLRPAPARKGQVELHSVIHVDSAGTPSLRVLKIERRRLRATPLTEVPGNAKTVV